MIRLEIDDIPPSLNRWTHLHWSKQRLIKQDWAWLIIAECLKEKCGRPRYKFARVMITLVFPVVRRRDIDNYAPKMIMDGLVDSGIIQDDRADWVKVQWEFGKGENRRTIIEIDEMLNNGSERARHVSAGPFI